MIDPTLPCAVILAAGHGRRYQALAGQGADKLLAACRGLDGVERTVFEHALRNVAHSIAQRVVVTRPDKAEIVHLAYAHDCKVVLLDSAGMADSIAAGVAASRASNGWLICLGDMPFIQPQTFTTIMAAMASQRICVPVGQAGYGHPVAFSKDFAEQLMALSGDQGARRLFRASAPCEVAIADPGIYRDIDLPDDLINTPEA